jgi:cell division protein FtsA
MTVVPLPVSHNRSVGLQQRAKQVAALDIGSTKISCMIASAMRGAKSDLVDLRVKGYGTTAARGIRSGSVSNIEEAERAIRLAVDAAERMAGASIDEVYVGVSGGKPRSVHYQGMTKLAAATVQQGDVDRAVSLALSKAAVGARTVLKLTPLRYVLDGIPGEHAPIGLRGRNLVVEVSLLTIETPFLQNLSDAIDRAHLSVAGFVPASQAAGIGCLSDDEMNLGCAVIDIGSSVTSLAIFMDGMLVHADALTIGGAHITNDIARGLCTSVAHAERLKSLYGGLLAFGADEQELISVPRVGEQGIDSLQQITRGQLTSIVRPRMEEILEVIAAKVKESGAYGTTLMRAVLTGGGAGMPGLRELSRSILGLETRIGNVPQSMSLPETMRQPSSLVVTGLLRYALDPESKLAMPVQAAVEIERQQMGYAKRVARWIADSF